MVYYIFFALTQLLFKYVVQKLEDKYLKQIM